MPVTGKLYDPGVPSALEAALAQQVASGQSPFAGSLLTGYGLQRQQNVAAVNEAQAQSHLLDLANALRIQNTQTSGSVAGAALSSGRGIGPALGAVNQAAGLGMDPNAIAAAAADADRANALNMAKTGAETANLGSEAGGGVADVSPVLQSLGFGITPTSVPRGVQQSTISANATMAAAREHSRGALEAAKIKAAGGGGDKGSMIELSGTTPETGEAYKYRVPPAKAPPAVQRAIARNSANTATAIEHNSKGSAFTPSGDAIANDPELPKQIDQIIRQHPGYHLINDNGDPHDVTDASGKVLYREFTLIDQQGNQIPARVVKRQ
jgi:hypothetical protein